MNKKTQCFSEEYLWVVKVHTKDYLGSWLLDYFAGISISHQEDGSTLITGEMCDMSAVYGLLLKMRDSDLVVLSLRVDRKELN